MKWEPKPVGDGLCEIPLTQGKVAIVDERDVEKLTHCRWHASTSKNSATFYAKGRATCTKVAVHMHRAILCFPLLDIDHINGNGLDNRRSNLRLCSPMQNACNIRPRAGKTSRFRGVYASGNRWSASIRFNRTLISLGLFKSEELAAAAYDFASAILQGDFGVRNGFKPGPETQAKVLRRIEARIGWLPEHHGELDGRLVSDPSPPTVGSGWRGFKYMDGRQHFVEGNLSASNRVGLHQLAKVLGGKVRIRFANGTTSIKFNDSGATA